ncbi:hypothetical protein G4V39_05805 [Thermosulfuriphilus ammonigenes]|uniref:Uncharacterized protein n=1 Tax=Thermosulfuriphilus ammonigenes TaxID=1936021 RepID=A0A6G7PVU1_9BACT|nr:hypothetical protein [Thermosulfuriphilus ammonigenes]MBA2848008.1 hypothetical protein [Thermosulfuriphilus ammonigenes]QIJ71805.1 hypothetical protein G4V39_05805 [Thermosulfuriphilus ammonigenes]
MRPRFILIPIISLLISDLGLGERIPRRDAERVPARKKFRRRCVGARRIGPRGARGLLA